MDFGFSIPTRGALATQQAVLALAQHGEQLGFGHLALPDHIRQLFTGSDADVAEDISAFRELDVPSLLFNFARAKLAESLAAMERFVAEVLPRAESA